MRIRYPFVRYLIAAAVLTQSVSAQDSGVRRANAAAPQAVSVTVGGDVPHAYTLTAADLTSFPRRTVKAADHGQPEASYEGVSLTDILARAGAPLGPELRGKAMATYVVVGAADGYQVVFALPELDSAFTDRIIILADHKNGLQLDSREGPVRLIVPGEKRPARWERQVVAITVRRVAG